MYGGSLTIDFAEIYWPTPRQDSFQNCSAFGEVTLAPFFFTARRSVSKAYAMTLRLSVCHKHNPVRSIKTAKHITQTTPHEPPPPVAKDFGEIPNSKRVRCWTPS